MHYKRLMKHGDVNYIHTRTKTIGVAQCSIENCANLVEARGWCTTHYHRWKRQGDPEYRLNGEVRNGRRVCPSCGMDKLLIEWSKGECLKCSALRTREYRLRNPYQPIVVTPKLCDCGQVFPANKKRSRYCSRECLQRFRNVNNAVYDAKRKARMRNVFVEHFEKSEVFERDNWTCQLCMLPVDRNVLWPHPEMVSLDHIIPLALGGDHSRINTQTAHLGCNMRKGARLAA